jgi:peroxiredoxin Q/BCP
MTTLQAGAKAPDFEGTIEDGSTVKLSDYSGKKLILYFYPKDDTPGCTKEGCNLRDNYKDLKDKGFEILGVSPDKPTKHQKFIDKYSFPFSLIADEDHSIIKSYGVWGPKKFMGREYEGLLRTTFVIDENGNIELVIPKVKTADHSAQILAELAK